MKANNEMVNPFKIGDKVRYVLDVTPTTLVLNEIYTVSQIRDIFIGLEEAPENHYWSHRGFEKYFTGAEKEHNSNFWDLIAE